MGNRGIPTSKDEVITEVFAAVKFIEDFFDSRGMDASTYFCRNAIASLALMPTVNAWERIREDFWETFSNLAQDGLNWAAPDTAEAFEQAQKRLALIGYRVRIAG